MLALAAAGPAGGFPEGAPWNSAGQQGCAQCHFDAPAAEASDAIAISGLPERVTPGARYALTVRLDADAMARAGFLLSAWRAGGNEGAGAFSAADERAESRGAQARSTEAGAAPTGPAAAQWKLEWVAPEAPAGPITFDLWANAANDDESPFGDATHHRAWEVPVGGVSD